MKNNRWLLYLIYIIILLTFLFVSNYFLLQGKDYFVTNFGPNYLLIIIFILPILCNIITGFLIGGDHFIKEMKRPGHWRVNLPKLLICGIPCLYLQTHLILLFFFGLPIVPSFEISNLLLSNKTGIYWIVGVILGYTIATSFYKEETQNNLQMESEEIAE